MPALRGNYLDYRFLCLLLLISQLLAETKHVSHSKHRMGFPILFRKLYLHKGKLKENVRFLFEN